MFGRPKEVERSLKNLKSRDSREMVKEIDVILMQGDIESSKSWRQWNMNEENLKKRVKGKQKWF